MARPTIRDVARKAKVSVATVSRVLNDSAQVSLQTRDKVEAVIEELGFTPHSVARQLSGARTYTIGIITPFFTRPSFVERLAGIREIIDESNYDLAIYSIRSLEQLDHRLYDLLSQNRVDGLITLSVHIREKIVLEERPDLPVVVIDDERTECYPSIVVDNIKGGQLATDYLIRMGHKRIGFIGDAKEPIFDFVSTQRRFKGFQDRLKANNLPINENWYRFGRHGRDTAHDLAMELLTQDNPPTAIFASSDVQAFGVIAAARELGLRIPDDIAIIGFDDIEAAEYMNLTTVKASMVESGRISARYLLGWLASGKFTVDIWRTVLPLSIVERSSV